MEFCWGRLKIFWNWNYSNTSLLVSLSITFQCFGPFEEGELCVVASRTGSIFHPACFQCSECATLLVDLIYFSHNDKVSNAFLQRFPIKLFPNPSYLRCSVAVTTLNRSNHDVRSAMRWAYNSQLHNNNNRFSEKPLFLFDPISHIFPETSGREAAYFRAIMRIATRARTVYSDEMTEVYVTAGWGRDEGRRACRLVVIWVGPALDGSGALWRRISGHLHMGRGVSSTCRNYFTKLLSCALQKSGKKRTWKQVLLLGRMFRRRKRENSRTVPTEMIWNINWGFSG